MPPLLMHARAQCAKGARCLRARGDSTPCPSPPALHIRARGVGSFHCSFLSLCRLPFSLCRSSHSAGFLCVSLSTTSLAERLVSSSASASTFCLVSASACSSFGFNGGIWTTSDFSKSDFCRTTRTSRALRALEAES